VVGGNVFRRSGYEGTEFGPACSTAKIGDLAFLLNQRRIRDQISQLGLPPMVCIANLVKGYYHSFLVKILACLSDLTIVRQSSDGLDV
jgi:hypothetical protein